MSTDSLTRTRCHWIANVIKPTVLELISLMLLTVGLVYGTAVVSATWKPSGVAVGGGYWKSASIGGIGFHHLHPAGPLTLHTVWFSEDGRLPLQRINPQRWWPQFCDFDPGLYSPGTVESWRAVWRFRGVRVVLPYRCRTIPLLFNVLVTFCLLSILGGMARVARACFRLRVNKCPKCGYSLLGCKDQCPECGIAVRSTTT